MPYRLSLAVYIQTGLQAYVAKMSCNLLLIDTAICSYVDGEFFFTIHRQNDKDLLVTQREV